MKPTHANPPTRCDVCGAPITDEFVDGKTKMGPWADMCPGCFSAYGVGLGVGRGQRYRREADKFVKMEG